MPLDTISLSPRTIISAGLGGQQELSTISRIENTRINTRMTPSQQSGLRYERYAHRRLSEQYGPEYIPLPWFRYTEAKRSEALKSGAIKGGISTVRICQPDGLIIRLLEGTITIIEIKKVHCREAFLKLFETYLPVVAAAFGDALRCRRPLWTFQICEVTQSFEGNLPLPMPLSLPKDPHEVEEGTCPVYLIRPR